MTAAIMQVIVLLALQDATIITIALQLDLSLDSSLQVYSSSASSFLLSSAAGDAVKEVRNNIMYPHNKILMK